MRSEDSSEVVSCSLDLFRELSHGLRTPLGTSLIIAKDGMNGLPLTTDDWTDLVESLEKIRKVADTVKPLLNLNNFTISELSIDEVETVCCAQNYKLIKQEGLQGRVLIVVDLLVAWLRTLSGEGNYSIALSLNKLGDRFGFELEVGRSDVSSSESPLSNLIFSLCRDVGMEAGRVLGEGRNGSQAMYFLSSFPT